MDSKPITIKTNTKRVRDVEIDGVGFKVRSLGAGEQLSLSQLQRRLTKISKIVEPSDDEQDELLDLTSKLFEIIISAFDDGGDGSKTKELVDKLDPEDLGLLLEQVFAEKKPDGQTQTS